MLILLGRAGLSLALLLVFAFGVAAPPERCPPVSSAELRRSTQAAVDWLVRNQNPGGSWLYDYDADTDEAASLYNPVRHSGVTMGLYQAAAAGFPRAMRSADRGTTWALDRLLERDGWAAVAAQPEVDMGATALLVAGLVTRRETTGDPRYDRVLHRMGRFLVAQTEPSGAVLAEYDPERGRPVPGKYSKYYTGETYMALARLHRVFPGEGWGRVADRIGAYLATSRDDDEGHFPPIPDHWAAYGMAETVRFPERGHPPLTQDELDYARRQAELFGIQARYLGQLYGPWGRVVRPGYIPRGGWYGVIDEAFTGWWHVSGADPRMADLRAPIAERATCIAGLAIDAQSDAADAAGYRRPGRVEGAWLRDGETRMDDQQHALSGLLRTIPIAEAAERSGSDEDTDPPSEVPSALLWGAVLVLALNPPRAAFGLPRRTGGRATGAPAAFSAGAPSSRPRAGATAANVAAVGGALAAFAVCIAAALGNPVLDAVDVSQPSFRIAAGLIALAVGAVDVFRRPPSPEPALPGWRAALVPVAFPLVARPTLLVLALGAGADRSALLAAAAMVVGVAALSGLAAWYPPDGPRARALRWTARLLSVALVACGGILVIDGLLDV
jgi:small neutral amino acid transporter SnatA (MarC family)